MRELTANLKFLMPCLGNRQLKDGTGRFVFQRSPEGDILFLASWHRANMRFAAPLLGKHQSEVHKIHWDPRVTGKLREDKWYRDYYETKSGKRRYRLHEAFFPGQTVSINLAAPASIPIEDVEALLSKAGRFKGLSPWKPGDFGQYQVVEVLPRSHKKFSE